MRRADRDARSGQAAGGRRGERLGDAEVRHDDPAAAAFQQDVVRLDVAVNDAESVRGAERVGGFHEDAARFLRGQASPALQPLGQRLTVDEGHHEVDEAVRAFTHRVDRHDVRVRYPRGRLRFAQEADPDLLPEGQLGRQHFDGHLPLEPLVPGVIDHSHSAPADFAFDGIGGTERLGQAAAQRAVGSLGHTRSSVMSAIDLAALPSSCNGRRRCHGRSDG